MFLLFISHSLHGILTDLFIEAGYSEEIAQSNYLNMTAGVEEYSWEEGEVALPLDLYPTLHRKSRLS